MKLFEGTGAQQAYQPLNQFAYFTHTEQLEPMISAGAGVRIALKSNVILRVEFRDYLTPFPGHVMRLRRACTSVVGYTILCR